MDYAVLLGLIEDIIRGNCKLLFGAGSIEYASDVLPKQGLAKELMKRYSSNDSNISLLRIAQFCRKAFETNRLIASSNKGLSARELFLDTRIKPLLICYSISFTLLE